MKEKEEEEALVESPRADRRSGSELRRSRLRRLELQSLPDADRLSGASLRKHFTRPHNDTVRALDRRLAASAERTIFPVPSPPFSAAPFFFPAGEVFSPPRRQLVSDLRGNNGRQEAG